MPWRTLSVVDQREEFVGFASVTQGTQRLQTSLNKSLFNQFCQPFRKAPCANGAPLSSIGLPLLSKSLAGHIHCSPLAQLNAGSHFQLDSRNGGLSSLVYSL